MLRLPVEAGLAPLQVALMYDCRVFECPGSILVGMAGHAHVVDRQLGSTIDILANLFAVSGEQLPVRIGTDAEDMTAYVPLGYLATGEPALHRDGGFHNPGHVACCAVELRHSRNRDHLVGMADQTSFFRSLESALFVFNAAVRKPFQLASVPKLGFARTYWRFFLHVRK